VPNPNNYKVNVKNKFPAKRRSGEERKKIAFIRGGGGSRRNDGSVEHRWFPPVSDSSIGPFIDLGRKGKRFFPRGDITNFSQGEGETTHYCLKNRQTTTAEIKGVLLQRPKC